MKTGERKRNLKGFHNKLDKWGDCVKKISVEPMETDRFTRERAIEEAIDLAGELHYDLGG